MKIKYGNRPRKKSYNFWTANLDSNNSISLEIHEYLQTYNNSKAMTSSISYEFGPIDSSQQF